MNTMDSIPILLSFLYTNMQLYSDQAPSVDSQVPGFPDQSDGTNHPEIVTEQVWGGALEYACIGCYPGESYN